MAWLTPPSPDGVTCCPFGDGGLGVSRLFDLEPLPTAGCLRPMLGKPPAPPTCPHLALAQERGVERRQCWTQGCGAEQMLRAAAWRQLLPAPPVPGKQGPERGDRTVDRRKENSVFARAHPATLVVKTKQKQTLSRNKSGSEVKNNATEICTYVGCTPSKAKVSVSPAFRFGVRGQLRA